MGCIGAALLLSGALLGLWYLLFTPEARKRDAERSKTRANETLLDPRRQRGVYQGLAQPMASQSGPAGAYNEGFAERAPGAWGV